MNTDNTVSESKWENSTTHSEIISSNQVNSSEKYASPTTIRVDKSSQVVAHAAVPVVLVYEDFRIGDTLAQKPVIIDISKEDFGSLWVPLVTIGNYDISITLKNDYQFDYKNSSTTIHINGKVSINGNYKIVGLCSRKRAKKLVVNKVLNDFYEEIKKGINEEAPIEKKINNR